MSDELAPVIAYLRSPVAIRARCEEVFAAGLAGKLAHFAIDLDAMPRVVERVVAVTRRAYPDLKIPMHGRINHFRAGGIDRVAELDARLGELAPREHARAWIDLIVVSVLLDAGAGDAWRYREEATGLVLARSEGLAIASLAAFATGRFGRAPLRADGETLRALDGDQLGAVFQVSADNPLAGFDGRVRLVTALGAVLPGRPGDLIDVVAPADATSIDAAELVHAILEALAPIWPTELGDVWPHPAVGLVPLHEVSQWLAYSLFEPLARAGIAIAHSEALTGLAEYRNGGLLVDLGVLVPKHAGVREQVHAPGDEVIVEWRALTVALLDRVADGMRRELAMTPAELPMARVLEGGTWAAGREVAAERRAGGGPPIRCHSDGAVL